MLLSLKNPEPAATDRLLTNVQEGVQAAQDVTATDALRTRVQVLQRKQWQALKTLQSQDPVDPALLATAVQVGKELEQVEKTLQARDAQRQMTLRTADRSAVQLEVEKKVPVASATRELLHDARSTFEPPVVISRHVADVTSALQKQPKPAAEIDAAMEELRRQRRSVFDVPQFARDIALLHRFWVEVVQTLIVPKITREHNLVGTGTSVSMFVQAVQQNVPDANELNKLSLQAQADIQTEINELQTNVHSVPSGVSASLHMPIAEPGGDAWYMRLTWVVWFHLAARVMEFIQTQIHVQTSIINALALQFALLRNADKATSDRIQMDMQQRRTIVAELGAQIPRVSSSQQDTFATCWQALLMRVNEYHKDLAQETQEERKVFLHALGVAKQAIDTLAAITSNDSCFTDASALLTTFSSCAQDAANATCTLASLVNVTGACASVPNLAHLNEKLSALRMHITYACQDALSASCLAKKTQYTQQLLEVDLLQKALPLLQDRLLRHSQTQNANLTIRWHDWTPAAVTAASVVKSSAAQPTPQPTRTPEEQAIADALRTSEQGLPDASAVRAGAFSNHECAHVNREGELQTHTTHDYRANIVRCETRVRTECPEEESARKACIEQIANQEQSANRAQSAVADQNASQAATRISTQLGYEDAEAQREYTAAYNAWLAELERVRTLLRSAPNTESRLQLEQKEMPNMVGLRDRALRLAQAAAQARIRLVLEQTILDLGILKEEALRRGLSDTKSGEPCSEYDLFFKDTSGLAWSSTSRAILLQVGECDSKAFDALKAAHSKKINDPQLQTKYDARGVELQHHPVFDSFAAKETAVRSKQNEYGNLRDLAAVLRWQEEIEQLRLELQDIVMAMNAVSLDSALDIAIDALPFNRDDTEKAYDALLSMLDTNANVAPTSWPGILRETYCVRSYPADETHDAQALKACVTDDTNASQLYSDRTMRRLSGELAPAQELQRPALQLSSDEFDNLQLVSDLHAADWTLPETAVLSQQPTTIRRIIQAYTVVITLPYVEQIDHAMAAVTYEVKT